MNDGMRKSMRKKCISENEIKKRLFTQAKQRRCENEYIITCSNGKKRKRYVDKKIVVLALIYFRLSVHK
jgi:hypothetical protein